MDGVSGQTQSQGAVKVAPELQQNMSESLFTSESGFLIRAADSLFDSFGHELLDLDIKFPEIVVVGTENVGKSSLLEKIAGFPLFPRGEGITTRFPFRLRLHHCSTSEMEQKTKNIPASNLFRLWDFPVLMKFEGDDNFLESPDAVRLRVQAQNEKVQRDGLGVDQKELVLNMYGSMFANLTLLDTPGLLGVRGRDDPSDIVEKCRSIVTAKVENPDSIILAVLDARQNIRGTALGIQIIQKQNAEQRTVAVLTNIDRTHKDENISAILKQDAALGLPKLFHHFHAVIGRDTRRTFHLRPANVDDCEAFKKAVQRLDVDTVDRFLQDGLISEAVLERTVSELSKNATTDNAKQILNLTLSCLRHTRSEQEQFEQKYFAKPTESGLSDFQRDLQVDPRLLEDELLPYLGSKSLAARLSEMLTKHIGLEWSPKMLHKVKIVRKKCEQEKKVCGEMPPPMSQTEGAKRFLTSIIDAFSQRAIGAVKQISGELVQNCKTRMEPSLRSGVRSFGRRSVPDFQSVKMAASNLIVEYKALLTTSTLKCLDNDKSSLRLDRFPVFRKWLTSVLDEMCSQLVNNAQQQLEKFCSSMEPEAYLPSLHPDRSDFDLESIEMLDKVLPRIVHANIMRPFDALLVQKLALPPLQHDQNFILQESHDNFSKRAKLISKLQALKEFETSLRVIYRKMAEKYPEEGLFDIGNFHVPSIWTEMADKLDTELHDVQPHTSEYRDVVKSFSNTIRNLTIVRIQRVQNGQLWAGYAARKAVMDQRLGIKSNEKLLFHGTTAVAADNICENGFNRSYTENHSFGKGTYFARDASYSADERYSPTDQATGYKHIFRARVLVGEYCLGRQEDKYPKQRRSGSTSEHDMCDCTVDNKDAPSIFVTYHDHQTYPEYLLTFK